MIGRKKSGVGLMRRVELAERLVQLLGSDVLGDSEKEVIQERLSAVILSIKPDEKD